MQRTNSIYYRRYIIRQIIIYTILVSLIFIMGLPFFWMLTGAFKSPAELVMSPLKWFPSELRWSNFTEAWNAATFDRFFFNSTVVAVLDTGFGLLIGIMAAYAFTRLRVPGKNFIFMIVLSTLMIPRDVTLIPNYVTLAQLNWINTYQSLVLPSVASAFGLFLLRQQMLQIPEDLFDAAKIDGAGHIRIIRNISIPMCIPIIVTLALLNFTSSWNAYLWPIIITNTNNMRTLPVGLKLLRDAMLGDPWNLLMAASIYVTAPVLVLFLFTQKFFLKGITSGAIKGGG